MTTEINCPKCASVNIVFSKKRNLHVCEDCDHEFVPEKPFVAKRVFISYGHDEHTSLAMRLRDDLKTRGHDIWFDDSLQPGHDLDASIDKGLKNLAADKANAAVLLLLTPHSVRRPNGYCLNEVARALSLGLKIIPLMVVESEPPLSAQTHTRAHIYLIYLPRTFHFDPSITRYRILVLVDSQSRDLKIQREWAQTENLGVKCGF